MKYFTGPKGLFALYGLCWLMIALFQSLSSALTILIMGLISAVMALGVNIQWGYAGLFNVGVMGFAALGGVTAVWVSAPPVPAAWQAGGAYILGLMISAGLTLIALILLNKHKFFLCRLKLKRILIVLVIVIGFLAMRYFYGPATRLIESVDPAATGYLGGFGLPIILSWGLGALVAALAAWLIGKIALGLRADYLAIATLGISEIIIALLRHEDWLTRGVKNVVGLERPVPYEIDLIRWDRFQSLAEYIGIRADDMAVILVKLSYCGLFAIVLLGLLWLAETALASPWGRMMCAVRDNEVAAEAMGKDVKSLHLTTFILGSAVIGMAGAMLVTLDGQFTPGTYHPMRFTFLIWVMVIIGGSGNNWGAVLGGLSVWMIWVQAAPIGIWMLEIMTLTLPETSAFKQHLIDNAPQMRLTLMGFLLLVMLRLSPRGLIPERRPG